VVVINSKKLVKLREEGKKNPESENREKIIDYNQ
jgi:hypothetical protein